MRFEFSRWVAAITSEAPCIRKSHFVGDAKSVPDRWVATFISEVSPNCPLLKVVRPEQPNGTSTFRVSSILPVYFFPRHYRSLIRFTCPEQLLDWVLGNPGAPPCCTCGAKVSEWPVAPYISEGVNPSTVSIYWFFVMWHKICHLGPLILCCFLGMSIISSWAPVISGFRAQSCPWYGFSRLQFPCTVPLLHGGSSLRRLLVCFPVGQWFLLLPVEPGTVVCWLLKVLDSSFCCATFARQVVPLQATAKFFQDA
jgi:hypothetical protein